MIPPNGPLPPPPTVRQRLLAAAEAVCSTDGLYDARIEDMTRRAGIAKGPSTSTSRARRRSSRS
ncbi:MAG: hypothetical protein R2862_01530 [Thermoanaerobaculia bacterium]